MVRTQLRPLEPRHRPLRPRSRRLHLELRTHTLHLLHRLLALEARETLQVLAGFEVDVGVGFGALVAPAVHEFAQDDVRFADAEGVGVGHLAQAEGGGGFFVAGRGRAAAREGLRDCGAGHGVFLGGVVVCGGAKEGD